MALKGKLEVENETPIPASEFFHTFTKKLDNLQNITDHVHEAELHEGEDWHSIGSVKQWTLTVEPQVEKYYYISVNTEQERRQMALKGKLEIEKEIQTPASKFFHFFTKQLQHLQNITDRVHAAELHEGEDWHSVGSVKQWSYTIDGKAVKCKERIEVYDEANNIITFDLFEGDVKEQFKSFKMTLKVSDKVAGGGAVAKWIIEYEKLNRAIPDPKGYLDHVTYLTKDADAHLLTA